MAVVYFWRLKLYQKEDRISIRPPTSSDSVDTVSEDDVTAKAYSAL